MQRPPPATIHQLCISARLEQQPNGVPPPRAVGLPLVAAKPEHAECLGDTGVVAVAGVLGLGDVEREGGDGVITQRLCGGAGRGVGQCWSRRRGAGT